MNKKRKWFKVSLLFLYLIIKVGLHYFVEHFWLCGHSLYGMDLQKAFALKVNWILKFYLFVYHDSVIFKYLFLGDNAVFSNDDDEEQPLIKTAINVAIKE